ncbi:hypothetical protein HMPREF1004_04502 [Ralstonia pickettii]|nr:hypothetical protein HMPREF1004_04502 [Ralstonia pickettii]
MGAQLLATANTLERGYQALRAGGNLQAFQPHLKELGRLHRQWLSDLDSFKKLPTCAGRRTQGAGIRERCVRPHGRAHQAACRLIVGIFGGSSFVAPCM